MKHYWAEAMFIPDRSDRVAARLVLERFIELRGPDLEGGLVLRHFEAFAGAEVRTWWIGNRCQLITAHPDHPESEVQESVAADALGAQVAELGSPFVTVDLARLDDGAWRVVEVGDGQVSDRPSTTPPEVLLRPLLAG